MKNIPYSSFEAQQTIECARRLQAQTQRLRCLIEESKFNFLITDLELGLTFVRIASAAGEVSDQRNRNKANARKAYDAISRFRHRVLLTAGQRKLVDGKLAQLGLALEQLGAILLTKIPAQVATPG